MSLVCPKCGNPNLFCTCRERYNYPDQVNHPPHYADHYPFEVKDAIDTLLQAYGEGLTPYQCYCLGNELKYRLRAGFKDEDKIEQDIKKALFYNKDRKSLDKSE